MIQCIGSRNEENPNCSRICCQTAIKNALLIKKHYPETDVYILYRDIRTYGLMEKYYTEARRRGVLFFRFEPDHPPKVEKTANGIEVTFMDHILQRPLIVAPDILVLSAGMQATDTAALSTVLKAARTQEGFFIEAHVKLRPVDMAADGFYVCGTAHGPKLDFRNHRSGAGGGRPGRHAAGSGFGQPVGHHGQGHHRILRQVPHLRAVLPLRRAAIQHR